MVWEDPHDVDSGVFITEPTPLWVGMAVSGGFLPHIDFFLKMNEAESESAIRKIRSEMDKSEPLGPMSQEEFIEYTVMKDVPPRVWRDYRGNRNIFRIVNSNAIPKNRAFRDAWRLTQGG